MVLAVSRIISKIFSSFKKTCPLREVKPPEWNLFLVLRSLTHLPYEPLKLSSNIHITWKTSFSLAFALAQKISCMASPNVFGIHDDGSFALSFFVFDFVTKSQKPSIHDPGLKEFSVLSLDDFVGGERDKLLFCPVRTLRKYLLCTGLYHPEVSNLFVLMTKRKYFFLD